MTTHVFPIKRRLTQIDQKEAVRLIGAAALVRAPSVAEVLRLMGWAHHCKGQDQKALRRLREADALAPSDALTKNTLATVLRSAGDLRGAVELFRRACALAPGVTKYWSDFASALCSIENIAEAGIASRRARDLDPHNPELQLQLARTLLMSGEVAEAAAQFRSILTSRPLDPECWVMLSNLDQGEFDADDSSKITQALQKATNIRDRTALMFAHARASEHAGRHEEALKSFTSANAAVRKIHPWNASEFSVEADGIISALAENPSHAAISQGNGLIFLVGLPLPELQRLANILASHARVTLANERDKLRNVIAREVDRRATSLVSYLQRATNYDWRHLGKRYLVDSNYGDAKRPYVLIACAGNWMLTGAALSMLPDAKIIVYRREPLEAAFGCYRQLFSEGSNLFSYAFSDIAAYLRTFDKAVRSWEMLFPGRVYVIRHEALSARPRNEILRLLTYCELELDEGCNAMAERTVFATRHMTGGVLAREYGSLLNPLRTILNIPLSDAHSGLLRSAS